MYDSQATDRLIACGNIPALPSRDVLSNGLLDAILQLASLQREGKLGMLKLDISGCIIDVKVLDAIGKLQLSELGIWGGEHDATENGWVSMASGLCKSQQAGLPPIKLRLVCCKLSAAATNAVSRIATISPPPDIDTKSPSNFEVGGIPICIQNKWVNHNYQNMPVLWS